MLARRTAILENASFGRLKRRKLFLVLALLCIAGILAFSGLTNSSTEQSVPLSPSASTQPRVAGATIVVYLVGAVLKPGLYSVSNGSRLVDVVMRAGGLSPDADVCAVNLARLAIDGEQIIVPPKRAHAQGCTPASNNSGENSAVEKVSLSSATLGELDALPGIGPALAQRIIDWRSSHGGFSSVAQLDAVAGIGPALLAQLKRLVIP